DNEVVAVYDWESVGPIPESEALAAAARTFSVDWDRDDVARFPAPGAMAAFIAEYELARGEPLSPAEREETGLTNVRATAFGGSSRPCGWWHRLRAARAASTRSPGPRSRTHSSANCASWVPRCCATVSTRSTRSDRRARTGRWTSRPRPGSRSAPRRPVPTTA